MDAATQKPSTPARGRVIAGRVGIGVVSFLVVLIGVLALLPSSLWKRITVWAVKHETGRQAAIQGNLIVHLLRWNPEVTVEGFTLANANWIPDRPMLSVRRLDATVSLASLFKLAPVLPRVQIDGPDIDLERDATSRANWDFSSPGASRPQRPNSSRAVHLPAVRELILSDGRLTVDDRIRKLTFNGRLSIAEKQAATDTGALNLRGSGLLNGKPFDLRLDGGPLINVDPSKPYDFDLVVTAADIRLSARTTVQHPFDLASITSTFHITGADLADLYYLTGLALPNTPRYDVSGTAVRDDLRFHVDDFKGRLGGSDVSGKLALDTGLERPKLTAALTSKVLNLADLAASLGTQATPGRKAGTLTQPQSAAPSHARGSAKGTHTAAAAADSNLLLPDADLQVNRVRAMDADLQFDAASVTTPKLPMKKVRFHLLLNDARISLAPLEFTLPEGTFSGEVTIDARQGKPRTDIDMRLQNVDLSQFKPRSGNAPLAGELVGRIRLHGSGTSVHKAAADANGDITVVVPHGEMRSAFAELTGINVERGLGLMLTDKDRQTQVRCGVVSFHADDGILKAGTLVLDTTHVLITGTGSIDMKDEDLDLSLHGQPKQVRLLRLRSPIAVGGTLLHPSVGLHVGNLAGQAGVAVALGVLLTPVAALLAFVDAGLAKDADCAALVGQAEQGGHLPPTK